MRRNIFIFAVFTVLLAACSKEKGNIRIEGQGDGDQLSFNVIDSLTLIASTIDEDSLPGNGISYALIGQLNDGIFGISKSSLYANLVIIEPNSTFPNTEEADSAILFIPAVDGLNFYGNRNYPHQLSVYRTKESINSSNTYYQTNTVGIETAEKTTYYGQLIQTLSDSINFRKGKLEAFDGLRIKLSKDFAKYLMNMPKDAYENNTNLAKYFTGIAIVPETMGIPENEGTFAVFDINNIISTAYRAKIMLYYQDTNTFLFGFGGSSSSINNGITGPYKPEISEQLTNGNKHYSKTYAQALSGVKTKIEIPYLTNLIDNGNIAIHRAEIEFFVQDYSEEFFAPPRMNLFRPVNANSKRNYLIEDALVSSNYGGLYDPIKKSYKFRVTRHIQDILNKKYFNNLDVNNGLYLAVPSDQPVIGARCVIDQTKTKLYLNYSKLK